MSRNVFGKYEHKDNKKKEFEKEPHEHIHI